MEHIAVIALQRAYRRRIRFNKAKRIIKRWLHKLSEEIRQSKQRNSLAHQMAKAMQDGEDEDNEDDKDDENDDEADKIKAERPKTFFGKIMGMFSMSGGKELDFDFDADEEEDETDSDDDSDSDDEKKTEKKQDVGGDEDKSSVKTTKALSGRKMKRLKKAVQRSNNARRFARRNKGLKDEDGDTNLSKKKEEKKKIDLSLESDESIREMIKHERKIGRTWNYVTKRVFKILMKVREAYRNEGDQGEVKVNWKQMDNIMMVFNGYYSRGMVYLNVVLSIMMNPVIIDNTPQTFVDPNVNGTIANVSTVATIQNVASPENPTSQLPVFDYRAEMLKLGSFGRTFLLILDGIVYIPQFTVPENGPLREDLFPDNEPFTFFFYFSMAICFFFPIYTIHAISKARDGTLGCGPDGKPASFMSREGAYMQGLSFIQNNLYFGVLRTLASTFACTYSAKDAAFFLNEDKTVECFTIDENTQHLQFILFATIAIALFFPLATMLVPTIQFYNKALDLKFDQGFVIAERQADLFVAIFAVFFSSSPEVVLFGQLFICTSLALLNYQMNPCLVKEFNFLKTWLYLLCAYFSFCGLIYVYLTKSGNVSSTVFFFAMGTMFIGWPVFGISGYAYYNKEWTKAWIKKIFGDNGSKKTQVANEEDEKQKLLSVENPDNETEDDAKGNKIKPPEHTVVSMRDSNNDKDMSTTEKIKLKRNGRKGSPMRRRSTKVKPI